MKDDIRDFLRTLIDHSRKAIALSATALIVLLVSTCDLLTPGLGEKVDITAPGLSFTTPHQNDYVSGTLSLQGTATDDRGLTGLTITYKNAANQDVTKDVSISDGKFSIELSSGTGASDSVPDGEQTFTLTGKDASGKETQAVLIAYVDNHPPTVLVTVPQTYGGTDKPIMGPLIDLKGEVYDASPISRVDVSLWNAAGTQQLATKQADGTNTWSVRFTLDDATYPDLGVFTYRVVVTDKAGNRNQYAYHSQDIFNLKDTNSLFPTVDQLGKVDQKHETDTLTGITYAALFPTRIGITGKYGDFKRYADATLPEINFTNLLDSASDPNVNVLSSKVPINGFVNPGPANNPVIANSIRVWIRKPSESFVDFGQTGSNELDPADIKKNAISSSINFQAEPILNGSYLGSGTYYVKVEVQSVGGSHPMVSNPFPFTIDSGAPLIASVVPARLATLKRAVFGTGPLAGQTGVELTVTVTDDNQVDSSAGQYTVGWSTTSSTGPFTNINSANIFAGSGDAPANMVRTARLALGSGFNDIWFAIEAHDNVGTVVRETIHYTIDETPPTIIITDPVASAWLSGSIYPVKGTAADAGGVQRVEYSLNYTNDGNDANDTWTTATGTATWTAQIDLSAIGETASKTIFVRAIDNANSESAIVSRSFGVDQAPPQIDETGVGTGIVYKGADFNLSGTASDSLSLKLYDHDSNTGTPDVPYVELKIGAGAPQKVRVQADNTWTVPITVNPDHSGDGTIDYVITATDLTGVNIRSVTRTITIDTTSPTVDISSVSPIVGTNKVNGIINFTASASDENGLNGIRYWVLPSTVSSVSFATGGSTDWSSAPYTAAFDTTSLSDNANYNIWIVARDKAGNEKSFSKTIAVDQSSDNPIFTLTNMDQTVTAAANAATNLQETNAKLTATLTDDDMVDVSTIDIRIDANNDGDYSDGGVENWTAVSGQPTTDAKSASFEHVFPIAMGEGVKNFQVRADDLSSAKSGKSAVQMVLGPIYFAIDRAPPTVSVTAPASGSFRKTDFLLTGTASDANGLKTADLDNNSGTPPQEYVEVSMDGGTAQKVEVIGGFWSMPVTVPADHSKDGSHTYDVVATDSFNKTNSASVNISFDTTAPSGSITNPSSDGALITSLSTSFDGTVSDPSGSGVKKVQFATTYTNDSNDTNDVWVDASGQSSWSAVVADLSAAYGSEGSKTIGFRFEDNAGNISASIARTFVFDLAIPTVSISGAANVDTNAGFSISGSAADTNGVASISVTQKKDSGSTVTVSTNSATGTTSWSLASLPRDPASIGTQLVADGTYVYRVTAVDVAGRSSIIATVTVRVDQTAPDVLTIVDPAPGQTGINSVSGAAYIFKGSASDAGLGVAKVYYLIDNTPAAAAGIAGYTTLNVGNGNWSFTADLDTDGAGADGGMAEGHYYIHVKAEDSAGNRTADVGAVTTVFDIDQAKPDLAETALNTTSVVNKKTGFSLSGTSADTNGVASVSVTQKKDSGSAVAISTSGVSGTTSWSLANLPRDPASIGTQSLSDGVYEYVVTVTDVAGKTTTLTRTVLFDTSAPTISISSPAAADVVNSNLFTVAGTASDASGSGVQLTEYTLSYSNDGNDTNDGWVALSGTSNWNKSVNLGAEGAKTLSVRATDLLGNISSVQSVNFNLDQSPPTLGETAVGAGTAKRSGDFVLSGTAGDTNGLTTWDDPVDGSATLVPYVEVSVNGAAATKHTVTGPNWTFAKTVAVDHSDDGEVTFVVTATDIVGRTTSITRIVNIDSTKPTLTLDPGIVSGLNSSVNKVNATIGFRFSADDAGVGLEKISGQYRAYYTVVGDGVVPPQGVADIQSWTPVNSTSSVFQFSYDTTGVVSGDRDLYIGVFDSVSSAPNIGVAKFDLSIDQNSDRPIIAFDNINDSAATNPENGFGSNPNILMTIQDDDAVKVSDLEYRLDANNDGDFNDVVELGTTADKWEDESVWYPVDDKPASNSSLIQAKIKLTGIPQGFFRIQVRARDSSNASSWTTIFDDNANYTWKKSNIARISVDYGPPSILVTAPVATTYNGNFQLTGSATDQLGVSNVRYTLDGGSTYTVVMSGGSLGNSPYNFNVAVDTSSLATGDYILQVEATDMGNSTATQQIPIVIDKTKPTITILQPGASGTLNGSAVAVSGEASDNRQVGAVFLWHGLVSDPDPALPSMTGPGTYNNGGYVKLTGTSLWSTAIDTTATVSTAADAYRIRIVAIDGIGNVGVPVDRLVKIDQETDRPGISFSNLSLFSTSRLALGNLSIIGTISDDDSVKATGIQIALDRNGDGDYNDTDEGFVPISQPPSGSALVVSWVHEITDLNQEGLHHVKVRAQDINQANGDYSTGYGWKESPSVAFFIDNGPPALDVTAPTLSQRINVSQFTVTGTTNDTNGIKKVVIWVDNDMDSVQDPGEIITLGDPDPGVPDAPLTTDNTTYNISQVVTGLTDGVKTVRVSSYDSSDALTVRELTVVIDTTAPSATVSTPAAGGTLNGTVQVIGTATDNYEVSKVYYNVQLAASAAPAFPGAYTLLSGQTYAWNFNLNTTAKADGAYTLRLVVEDGAGNNNSASPSSVNFSIDQNTDKPVVHVLTLDEAGTAVQNLLPGSLQIGGTVQDDDAVEKTKIQIRSRPLPADNPSDWTSISGVSGVWTAGNWTSVSGQPLTSTALASWSHTFTGFTDGQYEFQIRAADINDTGFGTYSSVISAAVPFAVDLSLPSGTIAAPVQASFQRSNVSINGSSTDASGVKKVSIAYNTSGTYGSENVLYNDTNAADGYVITYPWSTSFNVDTVTHSNDGQVYYRLTITDAFDKVRTYEQYFTVDTTAPTVGFQLPADNATVNGSVLFRGTTTDTNQVAGVYYKINNNTGAGTWAPGNNLIANGWTLMSGTFNWQQRFKSTSLSDGAAKIYIVAEDLAGNRTDPTQAANQLAFTVSQSTNLPVVTLSTANASLLDNAGTITGTVTDDDGVDTSTLQISFDGGSTWQAVSNPGSNGLSVSFSHALSGLAQREAAYSVKIRVSDIGEDFDGGDFSGPQDISPVQTTSSAITIYKDDGAPSATVANINNGLASSATLQGVYINDKFTLTGAAIDGVRVASVDGRIDLNNDGDFADAGEGYLVIANTGTNYSTWSWAVTGLTLSVSSVSIELRISDALGRQTTQPYTLLVDTSAPTIAISSTAVNADTVSGAYNSTYNFQGTASDNVVISKVYYRFATTASGDPGAPSLSFTGWTQAASSYSWTAPLDTVATETALSHTAGTDLAYSLWAVAVDSAGNIAARQHIDFTINQNSDKPVVTLSTPTAAQVLGTGAKAIGSVTDDDGLATIAIRIDANNDGDFNDGGIENYTAVGTPATVSGKSVNFENLLAGIPLVDGFYKLQVRARDTGYTGAGTPFNETESAVIDFSLDTLPPAINITQITVADRYPADGVSVSPITSSFNGRYINNDMTLTMNATDASGITSVEVSVDGGTTWLPATNGGSGVYTRNIPILGQGLDGTQNFQYRATDANGKVTSSILTLIVDTAEPVVGFTSPASISTNSSDEAPNVNGSVTIFGTVSDSSAVTSVTISAGKGTPHALTVGGNNLSWQTTFAATTYQNATDATETGSGTNVWRLPITVTTYDFAGNRGLSTGYVDLDPNGDKPIVTISSPSANASVTGIITLNGTVTDDDGSSGTVDIDVDADNNGSYADGVDQHFTNVTVSNGAWSQQINTAGTLTGTIRFRVTPKDSGAILGDSVNRLIFIDASLPQIVGYNGSAETGAPTPATGSRQSGTVTVRALFKDDDVIPAANFQVSLDGGSTYVAISAQPGYTLTQLADAGGKKRYDVQFQVNTATYFADNSGNGSLSIILQITDNTYKPAVVSLSYAVDNRPPETTWNYDSSLTSQSGLYTFSGSGTTNNKFIGSAKDGGSVSGISYVDMFFVKSGNILNPKTGSGTAAPTALTADKLYAQIAFTAANVNAGTDIFTIDRTGFGTVNNNLPVRFVGSSLPSGLSETTLYYVRDVSGNTFKVYTVPTGGSPVDIGSGSGTLEYAVTGVPFTSDAYAAGGSGTHYAVRADKRTELGSNDGNANGDGDGFQESLKDKGGYDEWFVYLDTTVLPDGPLTVYFVATDENGNKVISSANGQIANNPPSVSGFANWGGAVWTAPAVGQPLQQKVSGTVDLEVKGVDTNSNPGLTAAGWTVTVTEKWSTMTAGVPSGSQTFTPFFYNVTGLGGAIRAFTSVPANGSASGSGRVSINTLADGFVEGFWYKVVASVTDIDGNTASNYFYMKINNADVTAPVVTFPDLDQTSVSDWTSKVTPMSLDIPASSLTAASSSIAVALPSWMTVNSKVMFANGVAPSGFTPGTVYYLKTITNPIQLSATSGGTAIAVTAVTTGASYTLVSGGHLEAAADSNYNSTSDADVSGSVKLAGTAYDDTDIKAIGLQIDGVGATVSYSSASDIFTATAHGLTVGTPVYFTATTMPVGLTAGTVYYVSSTNLAANTFSVVSALGATTPVNATTDGAGVQFWVAATAVQRAGGNAILGFTYDWTYEWDSSRIATVAKKNVTVKVNALDLASTPNSTTVVLGSAGTVDVIPHIATITDTNGLSADVLRGATGKYSISSFASSSNTLTVRGYNLGRAGYTPTSYISPAATSWTTSQAATPDATYPVNQIAVSKNWAKSGYLTIEVNAEPSGNNLNNNSNANNIESGADPRTNKWTDDRYLWVWGVNQVGITTATGFTAGSMTYNNPDMLVNGTQPEFSWNDENLGNTIYSTSDTAATLRTGFRLTRPTAFAAADVSGTRQRFIATSFDSTWQATGDNTGFLEVTGFADSPANAINTATSPSSINGNAIHWSAIQGIDYYSDSDATFGSYRKVNRYPHPKLLAESSSIAGGANIYLTFYDSSTTRSVFQNLNFVSFRMTGQTTGNLTMPAAGNRRSPNIVQIPGTENGHSSEYYSMSKVGTTGGIAIAYYDATDAHLKLAYSNAAYAITGAAATDNLTVGTKEASTLTLTSATKAQYGEVQETSSLALTSAERGVYGGNEITQVTFTTGTKATIAGKYFTIYSGTTAYDVFFDNTAGQNLTNPGPNGASSIRVNINGATASAAGFGTAMNTAIRANAAFNITPTQTTAATNITVTAPGASTDYAIGTLTGAGTMAMVSQGGAAKYFTISSKTTTYDVYFDDTAGQTGTNPGASGSSIKVNINTTAVATPTAANFCNAVINAVRAVAAFNATAAGSGAATQNILVTAVGDTVDAVNQTLNTGTSGGTITTGTQGAGKYFTIYDGTVGYDVWYDTTGTGSKPLTAVATNNIKVDISATTASAANFADATITAVRAIAAFNATAPANATATQIITRTAYSSATDATSGNLATGTSVGSIAVTTQAGTDPNWQIMDIDTTANSGQHVSMASDGTSLYLAYYDFDNADLKFAKVAWDGSATTPVLKGIVTVDSYLSAGSWTNVSLVNNDKLTGFAKLEPVIAYYADSYNGTKKPIRFAFPLFDATGNLTMSNGADSDGYYSGTWDVVTIQSQSAPKGGADTFNKTQLGQYVGSTQNLPIVGWTADKPEYAKLQPVN